MNLLDRLEGYPVHYTREEVLTVGGISAWVYFYNKVRDSLAVVESGRW